MRKISVTVNTGYSGGSLECNFEVEDNTSDEEIDDIALDRVFGMIE